MPKAIKRPTTARSIAAPKTKAAAKRMLKQAEALRKAAGVR